MPIDSGNPTEIDQEIIDAAKKLNGVVICGGEPMLNFRSQTMLENLSSDQEVRVHFNGTVLPKQKFINESARFKTICYTFSIDGVGNRFEYLRWPARWNSVVDNIMWLYYNAPENVFFAVNITVSQLNKEYYTEVVDWVKQTIPTNRAGKETIVNFNYAGEILHEGYLNVLDFKRNKDWKLTFPAAVASMPKSMQRV